MKKRSTIIILIIFLLLIAVIIFLFLRMKAVSKSKISEPQAPIQGQLEPSAKDIEELNQLKAQSIKKSTQPSTQKTVTIQSEQSTSASTPEIPTGYLWSNKCGWINLNKKDEYFGFWSTGCGWVKDPQNP